MQTREERLASRKIRELESKLKAITGGEILIGRSKDFADELHQRFLESVLALESSPEVIPFDRLAESGLELPRPDEVPDEKMRRQLHSVIEAMSRQGMYLVNTDHLSDRELYRCLWDEILREPTIVTPRGSTFTCEVDLVGARSEEALRLYLKYYACEEERREWEEKCGDIPPHEDPPYDRDRHLPVPEGPASH